MANQQVYEVVFNNRIKFTTNLGSGLEIILYGSEGGSGSIVVNEMHISYRLLAEFFDRIADKQSEPSFQAMLTGIVSGRRLLAAEIANM